MIQKSTSLTYTTKDKEIKSEIHINKLIKDLKANDKRHKKHNRKGGHRRTLRKSRGAGEGARGAGHSLLCELGLLTSNDSHHCFSWLAVADS